MAKKYHVYLSYSAEVEAENEAEAESKAKDSFDRYAPDTADAYCPDDGQGVESATDRERWAKLEALEERPPSCPRCQNRLSGDYQADFISGHLAGDWICDRCGGCWEISEIEHAAAQSTLRGLQ
jgi:ribosomal protein L37AE/L43A